MTITERLAMLRSQLDALEQECAAKDALLRRLHGYLGDGFAETPLARALVAEIENALGETR